MAENSSNGTTASKTQAKRATTEAKKSAAKTAKATKKAATKTAVAEKNQAQVLIESAVDFPVGAVLSVSDKVSEIVEPWTSRTKAEKELKSYRRKIEKAAKRTERRGTTARKRATTEARKTRKAGRARRPQTAEDRDLDRDLDLQDRSHRSRAPGQAGLRAALRDPLDPPRHPQYQGRPLPGGLFRAGVSR